MPGPLAAAPSVHKCYGQNSVWLDLCGKKPYAVDPCHLIGITGYDRIDRHKIYYGDLHLALILVQHLQYASLPPARFYTNA